MSVRSETSVVRPVRALVIGAGTTTVLMHLPVLSELRDRGKIVLALVCDVERERAAVARRKFGFLEDSGDGVAALERQDIDAVYIFGSAQLHYEYGLAALQSGKHLFVENLSRRHSQRRAIWPRPGVRAGSSLSVVTIDGSIDPLLQYARAPERLGGGSPRRYFTSQNMARRLHSVRAAGSAPTEFMRWTRLFS
jgi:hypothetical protein